MSSIGLFPLWVSYLQQNFSRRAWDLFHRTFLTVPKTPATNLFPPCMRHLQQDSSHRAQADILTHIHPGHDHSRIYIELRHLIRKWVRLRSLTTWMKFHARLPLSSTMTLPTFFSTQGTDVDSSMTLSLTMTKYITNRLIRISIRIGRMKFNPAPFAHPVW